MKKSTRIVLITGFVGLSIAGAYWGWQSSAEKKALAQNTASSSLRGRAAPGSQVVTVGTVAATTQDFAVEIQTTGTVSALNSVEIRPQISSVIREVNLREGQFVQAGQLLFVLDDRPASAQLAQAQAQLKKSQAALFDGQRQLKRSQELLAQKFVSQGVVDTAQAQVDVQAASVAADQAALQTAQVNLSYTRITAPSAGRAGTVNVYRGTNVQANSTNLVTITQLNPIAVSFDLPQRYLTPALQLLRAGPARVQAELPDTKAVYLGQLQFLDNSVDAVSGSVKAKAVFTNANQTLWPGAFVNVRLTINTLRNAVVVPQEAIIQSARGALVYVVDADGKALAKPLQVLHSANGQAAVTGVESGSHVVVEGRQNLRPGVKIIERPVNSEANTQRTGRNKAASSEAASQATSPAASPAASQLTSPAAQP